MTIQERLDDLRREYEAGKQQLNALTNQLLRIEGAILVLQEVLKDQGRGGQEAPAEGPAPQGDLT